MEYVGRQVKKEFQGHVTNFGLVQAYEPATGFFKIVYDGGVSEELELADVSSLMLSTESPPPPPSVDPIRKRGRPKKRRCIVNEGTDNCNPKIESEVGENLLARKAGFGVFDLNSNRGLDFNVDALNAISSEGNLRGLDLNEDVNLELNEKSCLNNVGWNPAKEIIDLNLDASEDCEKLTDGREGHCFDLNLQLTDDEVKNMEECELLKGTNESVLAERNMQVGEGLSEHDIKENVVSMDSINHSAAIQKNEDSPVRNCVSGVDNGNVATQKKKRGRKRKDDSLDNIEVSTPKPQNGNVEPELDSVEGTPLKTGDDLVDYENGVSGIVTRGRRVKIRKVLENIVVPLPTPSTGLRRSSRRAKRETLSDSDNVSNAADFDDIDQKLPPPTISFMSQEKKMTKSRRKAPCPVIPSPKVELPQSSCNLDLGRVPVINLISVYAFLRSFSTLLFLSPFELDDFVVSVKCTNSTLLFDSIHVSLLRTLRKHLESLSNEGSVSAINCLRSLNWDLLDLITWPMFAVEYLLLHSPGHIPGLDRCHLKILLNDYYKLPVSVKVEILQHLCDDVVEVEAVRLELSRRTSATEYHMDLARDVKFESSSKRKPTMDVANTSCVTEEDAEEPADWNSDQCCLCKMDGSLICCDGCPAAFHSRCVGVVSSLLPEGDWYCPECAIEKNKPWMKVGKSIRGAQLLGSDIYGRMFYSSCCYLLVLESCNEEYSFFCYNRNDLPALIEALESAPFVYDSIISAIREHWNVVRGEGGPKNDFDSRSCSVKSTFPEKELQSIDMAPSEFLNKNEFFAEKRSDGKSVASTGIIFSNNAELDNAKNGIAMLESGNNVLKMENHVASSEGTNDVMQTFSNTDTSKANGPPDSSTREPESLNNFHIPGKLVDGGNHHMTLTSVNVEKEKNLHSENHGYAPDSINSEVLSPVHCRRKYVNHYELARTASSFYEEFTSKSSGKTSEATLKTVEEIIAGQVKVVLNRFAEFSWSNIQKSNVKSRKERCGWCFFCRFPEDERDCLFIMNDAVPAVENFTCEILGIQSGDRKKHILDIMCHIICLEGHLQGLLLGPWLKPNYSLLWRKSVHEVVDLAPLKMLLLKLESNLHHRAISDDWRKHVDSVVTMGSASHIISSSARASPKHGAGRKKAKSSEVEITPSSNAATGLSLFWWRGGRGSRMLFSWKVLPHTLVSKAARQGGGKKIPGVLYPEIGEYAKRTKSASWRAAVETSTSVEQLALQMRELDANIRWNDIRKSNLIIDTDIKKPVKSFKKVIIRRKCSEGSVVRYLLDFGKRRFIPDVVLKHGTMFEDSSNERKRYWLEESHVPLHLLKSFEEKRVARKSNKMNSGELHESRGIMRKPVEKKGFEYLFLKAERPEIYQCGHCKKNGLVREAVSCQHCKGFFHKRHVSKSVGSSISACTYTCHKCLSGQPVKADGKKGKSQFSKIKNTSKRLKSLCSKKGKKMGRVKGKVKSKNPKGVPSVVPLRRSVRNAERVAKLPLRSTKVKKRKRRKQFKSEKGSSKKPKISSRKKRTPVSSSYWLNGLQLSRKENDERLMRFRSRMLLVLPGEETSILDNPKCSLCGELEHKSDLIYVACELCGVWLHFDALNPRAGEIENIIGCKCHLCLHKRPPLCPHPCPIENNKDGLITGNKTDTEGTREKSNCLADSIDRSPCQKSHSESKSKDEGVFVNLDKQPYETARVGSER